MKTKKEILDSYVPISLISKAEKFGACDDAIDWLRKKPRKIKALLRINNESGFLSWFITHVPVGRVYRKMLHTIYPNLKTWWKDGYIVKQETKNERMWYKKGELHRDDDKPAYEIIGVCKRWYKNGKLHRIGGKPAVESTDGYKAWYKNGVFISSEPVNIQTVLDGRYFLPKHS